MRDQVLIGPDQLAAELGDGLLVLDVTVDLRAARFDGDYRAYSGYEGWLNRRVPGSAHVDLLTEFVDADRPYHFARPPRQDILTGLARLGAGPGRRIVLYDEGRMQWAARAWWMLRCAGVESRVLDGGLAAWAAAGYPAEEDEPSRVPEPGAPPPVGAGHHGWADLDEVAAISAGERAGTLVCALSPEQFAGTAPSRYTRRGHIPRSRNLPASSLLSADHTVLPTGRLGAHIADHLAGATTPIVVYCGGGISACVTALGLTLAGHSSVRVYDGSLEEWTADPALPIGTG